MPTKTVRRAVHQRAKGPIDPSFGERVRELRAQRQMTQSQLAAGDFTKAFISHIERGKTRVSVRAAGILANRLGVDMRDLLAPHGRTDLRTELALVVGESHLARGETKLALESARSVGASAPPGYRARARRLEGLALLALGKTREAVSALGDAAGAFRTIGLTESLTRTTFDLAHAHASLDEPGEALTLLMECERTLNTGEVVDRTLELRVHALLAGILARMGDTASADLQAERANAIANDVVDDRALDTLYASLIATRRQQGDLEGALLYARRSLQLHERAGREAEAVHAWNNLAWIYIERGQYGRADDALTKAERLRKERLGGELGHLKVTRAKLELARGHHETALQLAEAAAADPSLLRTSKAQAFFIAARAVAASGARTPRVREVFGRAIDAYKDEPARKRAAVHEAYAEALAKRGLSADAYEEAQRALRAQKA